MKLSPRRTPKPIIDLSPMLDVMFQLILFFLVSTTFSTLPQISIQLPSSSAEQTVQKEEKSASVSISKEGSLFINQSPVQKEDFEKALGALCPQNERDTFTIHLYADKDILYFSVVEVLDILQKSGFSSIYLVTESGD